MDNSEEHYFSETVVTKFTMELKVIRKPFAKLCHVPPCVPPPLGVLESAAVVVAAAEAGGALAALVAVAIVLHTSESQVEYVMPDFLVLTKTLND